MVDICQALVRLSSTPLASFCFFLRFCRLWYLAFSYDSRTAAEHCILMTDINKTITEFGIFGELDNEPIYYKEAMKGIRFPAHWQLLHTPYQERMLLQVPDRHHTFHHQSLPPGNADTGSNPHMNAPKLLFDKPTCGLYNWSDACRMSMFFQQLKQFTDRAWRLSNPSAVRPKLHCCISHCSAARRTSMMLSLRSTIGGRPYRGDVVGHYI